ncbi:hypothetical protein TorRG33x02_327910 [Trema orientale]|uniref:Uncharacterized protein n=1 Tax=Trema orientale TaxID=63057 RepID=A0A2P5BAA5_TREOI|nr:hypothetical protein TorRG33x02_327910 [Trema orientale]
MLNVDTVLAEGRAKLQLLAEGIAKLQRGAARGERDDERLKDRRQDRRERPELGANWRVMTAENEKRVTESEWMLACGVE